jgi:phosphoribosyl 1,2-cyclic phosphodiesterase
MFSVRFWGVRGSIPCPGFQTNDFGGNTTCIEVRADDRLIIIDCGTGLRPLGNYLMANDLKKGPIDADIFLTHTHWDHIMGFPMFAPVFIPTSKLRFRSSFFPEGETLKSVFETITSYKYWPIRLSELSAQFSFEQIREGTIDLGGGVKVVCKYLNHPVICLGYRFEYQGKTIVTAFDTEPYWNPFPGDANLLPCDSDTAREGAKVAAEENEKIFKFIENADILIYDSSYTEEEYKNGKLNWGHTSFESAISAASQANVKKLILFHHEPTRTDNMLSDIERKHCSLYTGKSSMEILLAKEGLTQEAGA